MSVSHPPLTTERNSAAHALLEFERLHLQPLATAGSGRMRLWLGPRAEPGDDRFLHLWPQADGRWSGAARCLPHCLPWQDESVDALVLQHVLDGGAHSLALLGECVRVVAPGGRLWLVASNPLSPALRLARATSCLPDQRTAPGARRAAALLRRLGLVPEHLVRLGPILPNGLPAAGGNPILALGRSAYFWCAEKRVARIIPLAPRLRARGAVQVNLATTFNTRTRASA